MQSPAFNILKPSCRISLEERIHALVFECSRPHRRDDSAIRNTAHSPATADATFYRFPLPEAGSVAQNHGERSAPTVCDQIGIQLCARGAATGERVAIGA